MGATWPGSSFRRRPCPTCCPNPAAPVAVAAPPLPALPLGQPADLLSLAWARGLPVLAVGDFDHADTLAALAAFAPDVAVVACFTRRIPPAALAVPRLGFLNLHPSLLPLYRGPQPLFWQLRDGAPTGATVHYMDEGLDTGDIAAQIAVPLPDGLSGPEAERTLALAGLGLLRGVLDESGRGASSSGGRRGWAAAASARRPRPTSPSPPAGRRGGRSTSCAARPIGGGPTRSRSTGGRSGWRRPKSGARPRSTGPACGMGGTL